MEGLSVTSNDTTHVDLSAKIALLCLECSKYIKNDKDDRDDEDDKDDEDSIDLQQVATNLNILSKTVQQLLTCPNGRRLESSQEVIIAVEDSLLALKRLEQDLHPGITRNAISRRSKAVKRTAQDLMRCMQVMSLAMQGVQTHIANADDLKYFVKTDLGCPRSNPAGFLRTYKTGQTSHAEVYSFSKCSWKHTYFFEEYALGHMDYNYEEVPMEEAGQLMQEKLWRKVERELREQTG